MNILNYKEIEQIFNSKIFENSKSDLLTKLSRDSQRYIGLFRPTKPRTKIIQNITQSHEIKFGDAFEILIRKCFEALHYTCLPLTHSVNGETLNFDQLFEKNKRIIFIEQKVRDDHDSTKKRGQIENFEKKIKVLLAAYQGQRIDCYFYFIDPSLRKNKRYYTTELERISNSYSNINTFLCYGKDLFDLEKKPSVWDDEIIDFLTKWKKKLPDFPDVNFDNDIKGTMKEFDDIPPIVFKKVLENEELVKIIFPIIFPEKKVLHALKNVFVSKSKGKGKTPKAYSALVKKLDQTIKLY